MNSTSDPDSWFEHRQEAIHDQFVRGEIDQAMYESTLEDLWRTYDAFIEFTPTTSPTEETNVGFESNSLADGRAA